MRLEKIKSLAEKKSILLKDIASKIDMSYQNLNRCIRANKISANDLEQISIYLNVPVSYFFDQTESGEKNIIGDENQVSVGSNNRQHNTHTGDYELEMCRQKVEALQNENKLLKEMIEMYKNK